MVDVESTNTTRRKVSLSKYERLVLWVFKQQKKKSFHLSLVFCGDTRMRRLNKRYRKKDTTTDVLSFLYESNFGEILISLPVAAVQARQHKISLDQEIRFLIIHGILHLLGYDHKGNKEAKKMYSLQDRLLEKSYDIV